MKTPKSRYLAAAVSGLFLLVAFQNCQKLAFSESSDSAQAPIAKAVDSGNGYGYDGKLSDRFVSVDLNHECPNANTDKKSDLSIYQAIEFRNGLPLLTVDRCSHIPPKPIGLIDVSFPLVHLDNLSFAGRLFQVVDSRNPSSEPMGDLHQACRSLGSVGDKFLALDFLLHKLNGQWQVDMISGLGSPGQSLNIDHRSRSPAQQDTEGAGALAWSALDSTSPFRTLKINPISLKGQAQAVLEVTGTAITDFQVDCQTTRPTYNLIDYSQDLSRGLWISQMKSTRSSILAKNLLAPDSTFTAALIADKSSVSNLSMHYWRMLTTEDDSAERTLSVFLKKGSAPKSAIQLSYAGASNTANAVNSGYLNITWPSDASVPHVLPGSAVSSWGVAPQPNGWFRFWLTVKNNGKGNREIVPRIHPAQWQADGLTTGDVQVWGVQLVAGTDPKPYQYVFAGFGE